MRLILYSKPGCHLCERLLEKLKQISDFKLEIEVRDITTREDWFTAYQYEIPVITKEIVCPDGEIREELLPRPSPRASVENVKQMLQKFFPICGKE
ncbi:MAG: glutaredoxin family protein [Oscillatoriaceae bacterium SKW80]|nr:glutaredoxin family protein [Oscillatoriaceae bacterium SKYG93]MCX8119795.1 glutaredoxin family protein [Oscillatoriaceae bacterium SKW80]MDW8452101.1 glutaredoxin family protein [Oscillatoriaceae cyanobacterium SKYGB_i_bin93]HIK27462.1 glutaredoxin family protein [Oscillatoriaceae cyanobacterium M7585_C2015_266]